MVKLSIIIPIYNAEEYLNRCVNSCLSQGLSDEEYEILLCDDGSVDNSFKIAQHFQSVHKCIKVLTQNNLGAGMARNLGLKHAIGKYVIFVDSDDYLKEYSLLPVLERCEELDLDVCKYVMECIILDTGKHVMRSSPIKTDVVFSGDTLLGMPEVPLDSACSSFYKRQFLLDYNLYFSSQTSSEDVVFTLHVYQFAKRMIYVNDNIYTYEIRTGTRGHSLDHESRKRYIMNNVRNAAHVMDVSTSVDILSQNTRKSLVSRANSMTAGVLIEMIRGKKSFSRDDIEEALSLAKELNLYPIRGKTLSWKTTLMAHFFLNRKRLFLSKYNL